MSRLFYIQPLRISFSGKTDRKSFSNSILVYKLSCSAAAAKEISSRKKTYTKSDDGLSRLQLHYVH
jgi:hypothetical protein